MGATTWTLLLLALNFAGNALAELGRAYEPHHAPILGIRQAAAAVVPIEIQKTDTESFANLCPTTDVVLERACFATSTRTGNSGTLGPRRQARSLHIEGISSSVPAVVALEGVSVAQAAVMVYRYPP
jgi:hypothetical protein